MELLLLETNKEEKRTGLKTGQFKYQINGSRNRRRSIRRYRWMVRILRSRLRWRS